MAETANSGGQLHRDGVKAQLYAEQIELVSRLDRQIEELRRVAAPGYEKTIAELQEAMLAIHDAIARLTPSERR
jgi:uncharacterized protein YdcH (DUF465 family)